MNDNLVTIVNSLKRIQTEGGSGNFVVLNISTPKNYYIQFTGESGKSKLYAEAVSNNYLQPEFVLSEKQIAQLQSIGWCSPPVDGNFYQEWQARNDEDRELIAEVVMLTFTEVYGLSANQLLDVKLTLDGADIEYNENAVVGWVESVEDYSELTLNNERKLSQFDFEEDVVERYAEDAKYWKTTVPPAKSQAEIRQMLEDFGATNSAIMQGQTGKKPTWMVRFDWNGYNFRYEFAPLECKEPDKVSRFGWKKRSHAEQARFQLGRKAVHFVRLNLEIIDKRDNLEIIANSLKRFQVEGSSDDLSHFRTERHYIFFKRGSGKSSLYAATSASSNSQSTQLKSMGWHPQPSEGEFSFYREWQANTDKDIWFIAQEVIGTFIAIYGLTPNRFPVEMDIMIGRRTVESITAQRGKIHIAKELTSYDGLGKLIFENDDLQEEIPVYWKVDTGEIAVGNTWKASIWFSRDWHLPEKAADLVLQYLTSLTTIVKLQISSKVVGECGIVMEEYESMEDFFSWGVVHIVSSDLGRAYQEDGTLWGNILAKK